MKQSVKNLFLLILVLLMLSGCKIAVNSPQSARDDNYGIGQTSSDYVSPSDGFDESGSGDEVYSQIPLKKGAVILSIDFRDGQHFAMRILDNDGTLVGSLEKNQPFYSGKQVIQVPKDGDNYIVEIKSDGSWKVKLNSTVLNNYGSAETD